MTRKRRRFTADFKKCVALEVLRECATAQAVAVCHEVHPNQVSAWKPQAVEGLDEVFSQPGSKRGGEHEATIRNLHAEIGELTVERDFFCAGCSAEPYGACCAGGPRLRAAAAAPAARAAGRAPFLAVPRAAGKARGESPDQHDRGRYK